MDEFAGSLYRALYGVPQPEALTVAKLEAMIKGVQASTPEAWILISPQGVIMSGANPVVMAARAFHPQHQPYLGPLEMRHE